MLQFYWSLGADIVNLRVESKWGEGIIKSISQDLRDQLPGVMGLSTTSKCFDNPPKAYFYVKKTLQNNWSRSILLNFIDTDLYQREGKSISNFEKTLPILQSDLPQEMTKDPYSFDFLTITERYREKELK